MQIDNVKFILYLYENAINMEMIIYNINFSFLRANCASQLTIELGVL